MDFPTKLVISNEVHPTYTVIDLQTPDRLGLLYDVLYCFSGLRVTIAHSRVATEKGAAFDSFYVTDFEGRKLTSEATLRQLRLALLRAATNPVTQIPGTS
jgi:[protein-PII] uridylyltransferase